MRKTCRGLVQIGRVDNQVLKIWVRSNRDCSADMMGKSIGITRKFKDIVLFPLYDNEYACEQGISFCFHLLHIPVLSSYLASLFFKITYIIFVFGSNL